MNDFTKEELEFVLDGTRHWCNQNIPTSWVFEFKNKINYMIDNYCDHEWICRLTMTESKILCKKCNKGIYE